MSSSMCVFWIVFLVNILSIDAGPDLPEFSWDTIPLFFHSMNMSGPWNDAALERIAQFPIVTMEKAHALPHLVPGGDRLEDTVAYACNAIHKVNPKVKVLYYSNSVVAWEWQGLNSVIEDTTKYRLQDDQGNDVLFLTHPCYNLPNPDILQIFIDDCLNVTKHGCDGCYLDRAAFQDWPNPSYENVTQAMRLAYNSSHEELIYKTNEMLNEMGGFALFNNPGPADNPGLMTPQGTAAMMEEWGATEEYILRLQAAAKAGHMIEAHAGTPKMVLIIIVKISPTHYPLF